MKIKSISRAIVEYRGQRVVLSNRWHCEVEDIEWFLNAMCPMDDSKYRGYIPDLRYVVIERAVEKFGCKIVRLEYKVAEYPDDVDF